MKNGFHRISNECCQILISISKICLRSSPTQLTVHEQAAMKNILLNDKYIHLPFSYKWSVLLRKSSVVVGKSVFYKYAHHILGSFSKHDFHVSLPAVRASSCFEILHMDSTLVKTTSGLRVYIHFVMDNFSKAILGAACCDNARSSVVAQNVKTVIEKYGLRSARLYSDDGPENHGEVEKVLKGSAYEQVFANFKLGKSNNMIEALNKKFKRFVLLNFMPRKVFLSTTNTDRRAKVFFTLHPTIFPLHKSKKMHVYVFIQ